MTLTGNSLPATGQGDVLFSQGASEFPSDYLWSASPNLVVARVPTGVLANGPAAVRLKNPAGTVSTNSVPLTISGTPGAPMLLAIYSETFGGVATTTLHVGQQFLIEADGTGSDPSISMLYWTQGTTIVSGPGSLARPGPTGRVGTVVTVPAGVTPGAWTLSVTHGSSTHSNGVAVNVVP